MFDMKTAANRAAVIDRMRGILDKCTLENRDLNPAEIENYTRLEIQAEQMAEQLGLPTPKNTSDRREHVDALLADLERPVNTVARLSPNGSQPSKESEAGILLDHKTLRAGSEAIANKLGVRADRDAPTLADFVRGVAKMKTTPAVQNALSVGTDSSGGYSVPTVLMPGILEALVPASSLLTAGAGVVAMDQGAKSYNTAAVDAIPTAAWRAEAGAVSESDPTFKNISITPRDLSFRFKVSRELLMDSDNIDSALRTVIAQAFAKELDRAGLRGSGTAPEIRGLLNMVGIQSVTNGAAGASPASYANFISAWQAITTANAPAPTAAIMHPRSMAKFAGLADTTGQPLRRPELLQSMRFVETSQIPINLTVGASSDCSEIYVGDFTQLRFYQREGVSVQLATELYAETGQIGFFCHTRVDVVALYPAAFAVVTGVKA